jgi:acetylornithine deacetylase/succinyl-diaminopimelate desuccinylase-like protein
VIALMAAIDALVAADKMPDVTVKLILDGEEERGSPTLAGVLDQIAGDLVADVMLFCDGPMHQSGRPQLVLGVRGSMTVDLTTFGPNRPLHSGHYGNWAPNPNEILMRLLLSLKDDEGRVVVEGYSDNVRAISAREATAVAAMPSVDAQMKHELGLGNNEIPGERLESATMRPAIVVRGISGGGVGPEARNIIEPTAQASLNLRLVPGQKPEALLAALRAHFEKMGMTVSANGPSAGAAREHHLQMVPRPGGYRSFRTSIDANAVGDLKVILDRLGDQETLITPTMGGSLPIYLFEDNLDAPIVILPVANHDNNQHGRDENLRLKNLFDAIEMYAEVLVGLTDEP